MAKQLYPITGSCVLRGGPGARGPRVHALAFFRCSSTSGRYRALAAARKSDSIGSIAHYGSLNTCR
jgi:hypothetical protein